MHLVHFLPQHIEGLKLRSHDQRVVDSLGGIDRKVIDDQTKAGPCFTAVHEGKILAVGGIRRLWVGSGEPWLLTSDSIDRHGIRFALLLKNLILPLMSVHGFWRLQATVYKCHPSAIRFLKIMGFECEAPNMRKAAPDQADLQLWSFVL